MTELAAGMTAPDFSLLDQTGCIVDSRQLRGRRHALFFFPKAGTRGCTHEAQEFQRHLDELDSAGCGLVGISPDSPTELRLFAKEHALSFPLLSDVGETCHRAFGAFGDKVAKDGTPRRGILRATVVMDPQWRTEMAWYRVDPFEHVSQVVEFVVGQSSEGVQL